MEMNSKATFPNCAEDNIIRKDRTKVPGVNKKFLAGRLLQMRIDFRAYLIQCRWRRDPRSRLQRLSTVVEPQFVFATWEDNHPCHRERRSLRRSWNHYWLEFGRGWKTRVPAANKIQLSQGLQVRRDEHPRLSPKGPKLLPKGHLARPGPICKNLAAQS